MLELFSGAQLVDSATAKDKDGNPKKVRQCHLGDALRYSEFVAHHAMNYRAAPREKILWLMDRGRLTRNQARTLF